MGGGEKPRKGRGGRHHERAVFGLDWLIRPPTLPSSGSASSRIKRNPGRRGYAVTATPFLGEHEMNRGYWSVAL